MEYTNAFNMVLRSSSPKIYQETFRILLKIASNILNNPSDMKCRILKKSNKIIQEKILAINGGIECLLAMGFVQNGSVYELPNSVPTRKIQEFRQSLEQFLNNTDIAEVKGAVKSIPSISIGENKIEENTDLQERNDQGHNNQKKGFIKKIVLPPLNLTYTNPFLRRLETYSHSVLAYEDKDLQERARNLMPINLFQIRAIERMRVLQKHVKVGDLKDPDISMQELILLEMLSWFKNEFFSWVDSPNCESCKRPTKFSHMAKDTSIYPYTDRVELHKCENCLRYTPFPRYNDLNILLETRRGRCGEWANTFTLLCRSMKWDARFVVEEGDHVWTEVYSEIQKRWLHCDPCENVCDKPLMYEHGWGKKISYIMAYSAEDIQDVTWRYSSNHKEVLSRRTACSERELLDAIMKLRHQRQESLSKFRQGFLLMKTLRELVEFLTEKNPTKDDQQGRTSGSLDWRLLRGETTSDSFEPFIWNLVPANDQIAFQYSASLDKYLLIVENGVVTEKEKWETGVFRNNSMFRKEEHDWKNVYLARKEGTDKGEIAWKFQVIDSQYTIDEANLYIDYTTFENGKIEFTLARLTGIDQPFKIESKKWQTMKIESETLVLSAMLTGGKGDVAWQHAQLFRKHMGSEDFSLRIVFKLKPKTKS